MVSTLIFLQKLHFSTTTTVFFTIFLTLPASNGMPHGYKECSKVVKCGNITNIGYPFWGDHLRPTYCEHPGFQLVCPGNHSNDYPIMNHGGDDYQYQVVNITTDFNITLKLLQNHHHPVESDCLFHAFQHFLEGNLSDPGCSSPTTISLFECPHSVEHSFSCPNEHNRVYYHQQSLSDREDDYQSCNITQVTVPKRDPYNDHEGNKIKPEDVLSKRFKMDLSKELSEACPSCRGSGSDVRSPFVFVCFSKDEPQSYPHTYSKSVHFSDDAYAPPPDPGPTFKQGKSKHKSLAIAIPVSLCILGALAVGLIWFYKSQFQSPKSLPREISYHHMRSDIEFGSSFFGIPVFTYNELQEATNNFNPANELGDGGFGVVYYGKLRDGTEVAIKRLYERNYQLEQFTNEVDILAKLSHPNLVRLYGCTSRRSRELLLVYEYVPNGTVADHLYGNRSESRLLTWAIRMKIAIQTAEALSYLHASDIIHRDVKTNNILLDIDFTVKVADFGLSRLFPFDATHVTTAPQGTPGYLDPEYDKYYQLTTKSDVYSFGVVLIELISSQPAINLDRDEYEINLSTYAVNRIQNGKLCELVDQTLGFESDFKVKRMVTLVAELAFQCLQQERESRLSMEEVLEDLKRIESVDFEALKTEEKSRGVGVSETPCEGSTEVCM